jgi:hypothetical protein
MHATVCAFMEEVVGYVHRVLQRSTVASVPSMCDLVECCYMENDACSLSAFTQDQTTLVFPGGETRCIFSTRLRVLVVAPRTLYRASVALHSASKLSQEMLTSYSSTSRYTVPCSASHWLALTHVRREEARAGTRCAFDVGVAGGSSICSH